MTHRSPDVMIVELSCTVDELASRLHEVEGASLVRALPPGRAVVVLAGPGDAQRLARLPGVVSVQPDPLEHPTRSRD
jgi:hypothetical protein